MADDMEKQVKKILKLAKNAGVEDDFFFKTTFNRYLAQVNLTTQLSKQLKMAPKTDAELGKLFNATCDGANKTARMLIEMIGKIVEKKSDDEEM
nr:MAG TPA: terminase small subunit [Caudoviricetes sp.]